MGGALGGAIAKALDGKAKHLTLASSVVPALGTSGAFCVECRNAAAAAVARWLPRFNSCAWQLWGRLIFGGVAGFLSV